MNTSFAQARPLHTNHRASKTVLATVIGAGLFVASAVNSFAVSVYNFSMPITAPWFDTGIDLTAGTTLQITASGIVSFGPFSSQTTGPDGGDPFGGTTFDPQAILPNTVVVSLIGKIGGTTSIGTGNLLVAGVPGNGDGFVGSSYNQVVANSGRLFLGFNDQTTQYGDNSGSFSVVVAVPEPSTAALALIGAVALAFRRQKTCQPEHASTLSRRRN